MKKKLRLLLVIPLIIFFASILVVLFCPVKILPCETSATDPATSWEKTKCKGYYLTTNPTTEEDKVNVNNSAFLINLVILISGSFLFNGILFLLLFVFVSIKGRSKSEKELEKWNEVAALDDEPEQPPLTHKTGLFSKLMKKDEYEEKFGRNNTSEENDDL
ncbi:MAG: hypothetical protein ABIM99_02520 [Candidatus Dojkabacteria bacterium]